MNKKEIKTQRQKDEKNRMPKSIKTKNKEMRKVIK